MKMKNRIIFWNVDTQYDFMRSHGKLYVQGAELIEPNLSQITALARKHKKVIVNTADWHTPGSKELSATPDFVNTFPEHCMESTSGAMYVKATAPQEPYTIDWRDTDIDPEELQAAREIVLYKDAFDVFAGSPHTEKVLGILSPKKAIAYGVATNVCVDYAVLGLQKHGVQVYVPIDAIKGLPTLPLKPVLRAWEDAGVILTETKDLEKIIRSEK